MTEYEVWLGLMIDDAENPMDAAQQAQFMIQRPGSNWLYQVTNNETGKQVKIDLEQI
jgi:hypothetical protein